MELPIDCVAHYYEDFITPDESKGIYDAISATVDLSPVVIEMADGAREEFEHGTFVFADQSVIESRMAEPWGVRHPWFDELRDVRDRIEERAGRQYDFCRGYYYTSGDIGFDYHYDPPTFDDLSTLSALSLGQERQFSFRHVEHHDDICDVRLGDGSLLVMGENCRERYEHSLPVDPEAKGERMVLVFMDLQFRRPDEQPTLRTVTP